MVGQGGGMVGAGGIASIRHVQPIPPSTHLDNPGSHSVFPFCLKMMLINARSVNKKTHLIDDLIVHEDIDQTCITETWLGSGDDANLSLHCPPGFRIWHHLQAGR